MKWPKFPPGSFEKVPFNTLKNLIRNLNQANIKTEIIREHIDNIISQNPNYKTKILPETIQKAEESIYKNYNETIYQKILENQGEKPLHKNWEKKFIKYIPEEITTIFEFFNIKNGSDYFKFINNENNLRGLSNVLRYENHLTYNFFKTLNTLNLDEWEKKKLQAAIKGPDICFNLIHIEEFFWNFITKNSIKNIDDIIFLITKKNSKWIDFYHFWENFIYRKQSHKITELFSYFCPICTHTNNGEVRVNRNHFFFCDSEFANFWNKDFHELEMIFNIFDIESPEDFNQIYHHIRNIDSEKIFDFLEIIHHFKETNTVPKSHIHNFLIRNFQSGSINILYSSKITEFFKNPDFLKVITYFLNKKQKSLADFMKNIYLFHYFENYQYYYDKYVEFWLESFNFLDEKHTENLSEKQQKNLKRAKEVHDDKKVEEIILDAWIEEFLRSRKEMLIQCIKNHFHKKKYNIDKMYEEDFLDAYYITLTNTNNVDIGHKLLKKHLKWKFDNPHDWNQYKTKRNRKWLSKNLEENQQNIWLSENKKIYTSKNGQKIIIARQNDPLKIMMMGKYIENSCLHPYRDYSWSAIANAADANKWVYFIYNENNEILARVLMAIDTEYRSQLGLWDHQTYKKYLNFYPIYFSGKGSKNKELKKEIEVCVHNYHQMLARDLDIKVQYGGYWVERIESESWYNDTYE